MTTRFLIYSLFLLIFLSCSADNFSKPVSFYFWKSDADFNETYEKVLKETHTVKIYLHYFDVEKIKTEQWNDDGIYPVYVLKNIPEEFNSYEIVPVVFITNRVFQTEHLDIIDLAKKISQLVNQISLKHFNKKINKIQIDCDWTHSTRNAYFELLKTLKNEFEIDVTIRLHQIKFQNETGIPPVTSGTLMLYNIGDLKDNGQNSIIDSDIVKKYINSETSYPISLNVALPLFSQTIIKNNDDEIKIIKNSQRINLVNDSHFQAINESNFRVVKDTLFKGFYLSNGFNLKLEEVTETQIIESFNVLNGSMLALNGIIFYHLDESSFSNIRIKKLIERL